MARRKTFQGVLDYFGGVSGLACALDIEVEAIYQWKTHIPVDKCIAIEELSYQEFSFKELLKMNPSERERYKRYKD
jgi:hypothetical protein